MAGITYAGVPSVKQFQKDSSIALAIRSRDRILSHLDWLIERYHVHVADPDQRRLPSIVLVEIFLAANYWIKSYHENRPDMKKERYPAVLALFEAAVDALAHGLQVGRPQVAQQIKEIFGRDITQEGLDTDEIKKAHFFDARELALLRIRFKGGLAYHYGLDAEKHAELTLKPLDSKKFYLAVVRKNGRGGQKSECFPGWAPFVMTHERELYMTKHWLDDAKHKNIFHSSYTRGGMVAAAGTMGVKNGAIVGLRPDSGHYRPLENNFVGVLMALQMFGVRMDRVRMFTFDGKPLGTARQFMESRLSWFAYQQSAASFRDGRTARAQQGARSGSTASFADDTPFYQDEIAAEVAGDPAYNS